MYPMNRRHFEVDDMARYEGMGYHCIRALPVVKHIGPGRIVSIRADFFGVADLICFPKWKGYPIFVQVTSADTVMDRDMRSGLNAHKKKILELYHLPYSFHLVWHYKDKGRWKYLTYLLSGEEFIEEQPSLTTFVEAKK